MGKVSKFANKIKKLLRSKKRKRERERERERTERTTLLNIIKSVGKYKIFLVIV